ncbi:MAG: 5'-deoxynucleotidase, partial [Clostridia bacterium]
FGGSVNVEKIASLALYHDTAEVVSGDLPTPVKYYNATMKTAYTEIEDMINARLLGSMPEELQGKYSEYLIPDESTVEYKLMKIADKLSAYIKCIEERLLGNREFDAAYARLSKVLDKTRKEYPELGYFLDNFIDGFGECLDIL